MKTSFEKLRHRPRALNYFQNSSQYNFLQELSEGSPDPSSRNRSVMHKRINKLRSCLLTNYKVDGCHSSLNEVIKENQQLRALNQKLVDKLEDADKKLFSAVTDAVMGKPIMRQLTGTSYSFALKQSQMAANDIKANTNKLIRELKLSFTEQIEELQEQLASVSHECVKHQENHQKVLQDFSNYIRNTTVIIKQQKLFKWKARNRAAIKNDQKKAKELAQESAAIKNIFSGMAKKIEEQR
ncbi:unnamed protein product [Moneuplotes crassus]|uniref:Uncharacterized protein n=1 Tax=Euplotes crassus TaxID=5936 RepID=A0AAD1UJM5_EUPCR|nr:unnamed protein product [Moneuplotes crassus]